MVRRVPCDRCIRVADHRQYYLSSNSRLLLTFFVRRFAKTSFQSYCYKIVKNSSYVNHFEKRTIFTGMLFSSGCIHRSLTLQHCLSSVYICTLKYRKYLYFGLVDVFDTSKSRDRTYCEITSVNANETQWIHRFQSCFWKKKEKKKKTEKTYITSSTSNIPLRTELRKLPLSTFDITFVILFWRHA